MALPDPHRTRRAIGLALYLIGIATGSVLLAVFFVVPPLFEPDPFRAYAAMVVGAILAFPAAIMYLTVPRLLDRYDPEPWYALLGCLAWGGLAAAGISAAINSAVGAAGLAVGGMETGEAVAAVVSAPLVEEATKGLGVLGVFLFLRREFDGVVDGVMYATFTAIGFAAVENVIYYSSAAMSGEGVLAATFALRGVLSPWVHPLYTSMTGIGIGIAREGDRRLRWIAPVVGYVAAVFLHGLWNGSALFSRGFFCLTIPLWFLFVGTFLVIVLVLVRRRGRIIRAHLLDEVALGTITQEELDLVCTAFGIFKARMQHGRVGAELLRATARLALSKWHAARAMRTASSTISVDFIGPLRKRIKELRGQLRTRGHAPRS